MLHVSKGKGDTITGAAGDTLIGQGTDERFTDDGGGAFAIGYDPASPSTASGAETFSLGGGGNTVFGGSGAVTIDTEGGHNLVIAHAPGSPGLSAGTAAITVGGGNNTVIVNGGNGTVTSTGDNDFLIAALAADGQDGTVTINASGKGDVIIGGKGTDIITYGGTNAFIVAGSGNGTSITLTTTDPGASDFIALGNNTQKVTTGAGTDVIQFGNAGPPPVLASDGSGNFRATVVTLAPAHKAATLQFGFQDTSLASSPLIYNFNPATDKIMLAKAHFGDSPFVISMIDQSPQSNPPPFGPILYITFPDFETIQLVGLTQKLTKPDHFILA